MLIVYNLLNLLTISICYNIRKDIIDNGVTVLFGYVTFCKPELKVAEYDTYRAVYCSLCRQLGKDYGIAAKMILSYDFTFFAVIRLAIEDECCGYAKMRCPFNPMKKCMRLKKSSESMSLAAACAVILFYYKIKDDLRDKGFFAKIVAAFMMIFFSRYRKKAVKKYSDIDVFAADMMSEQSRLEENNELSIDHVADPSAKLLQYIFSYGLSGDAERVLSHMGYCIGKWVYVADALDDYDDDLKKRNYNPFKEYDKTTAVEKAVSLLNTCNVEAAADYELISPKRYKGIIANILYLGMPERIKMITDNKRKEKLKRHERSV